MRTSMRSPTINHHHQLVRTGGIINLMAEQGGLAVTGTQLRPCSCPLRSSISAQIGASAANPWRITDQVSPMRTSPVLPSVRVARWANKGKRGRTPSTHGQYLAVRFRHGPARIVLGRAFRKDDYALIDDIADQNQHFEFKRGHSGASGMAGDAWRGCRY